VCETSRDAVFQLAWPMGIASVGNGTSSMMVGSGRTQPEAAGFL